MGHKRAIAILIACALAWVALAPEASARPHPTTRHKTTMTGANVFPGPGDPDGSATLNVSFSPDKKGQRICWKLTYSNISTPTRLGIYRGDPGEDCGTSGCPGKFASEDFQFNGFVSGKAFCKFQDKRDVIYYQRHPKLYFAEVQTGDFPNGALRGQLK